MESPLSCPGDYVDKELVVLDVTPGKDAASPFFSEGIKIEPVDVFGVGDRVECRWKSETKWYAATVTKRHWYSDLYDVAYDHADVRGKKHEERELGPHVMRRLVKATGRGYPGTHRYVRQHWNDHLSGGELRNSLVALSSGEFVLFYDPATRVYSSEYASAMVAALKKTRAEMVCLHDRFVAYCTPTQIQWARETSASEAAKVDEATGLPKPRTSDLDDIFAFHDASTFAFRATAFRPKLHPAVAPRFEKERSTSGGCFDDRSHEEDRTFRPLTVGLRDDYGLFAKIRLAPKHADPQTWAPPGAAPEPPKTDLELQRHVHDYAETMRDVAPSGEPLFRNTHVYGQHGQYAQMTKAEAGLVQRGFN